MFGERVDRRRAVVWPVVAGIAILVGSACDTNDGREMREPTQAQRDAIAATTTVAPTTLLGESTTLPIPLVLDTISDLEPAADAFTGEFTLQTPWPPDGVIDASYTCDGTDAVPLITWTAPAPGAAELALVVTNDADGSVLWLVTGLAPEAGSIGGGEALVAGVEQPNSSGVAGWTGPCPDAGQTNTYRTTMYVLDTPFVAPEGANVDTIVGSIGATAASFVAVTGTYTSAG